MTSVSFTATLLFAFVLFSIPQPSYLVDTSAYQYQRPSKIPSENMDLTSPTAQTYLMLLSLLPEAVTEKMLAPLVPFMVRMLSQDLPAEEQDQVVGQRAGLLTGVFYLPLLVMNVVWGALSDRMGRKPILILGLLFGGLTTFVLGINSSSFTIALLCRFLAGVFGGNSAVAKGGLGEIHATESGRAWAYSLYGSLYAVSGILGPLIGGMLVKYSSSLSPDLSFLGVSSISPYFNCWTYLELTTILYLQDQSKERVSEPAPIKPGAPPASAVALTSPKLMLAIALYVIIAFCNMSWAMIFSLIFAAPIEHGGLGFTPMDTSFAMTIPAVSKLLIQTLACRQIVTALGAQSRVLFGHGGILGGVVSEYTWLVCGICLLLIGFVEAVVYLSVMIMISESVPASSLGAAFGLSSTFAAGVRTVAPPLAGIAWELASEMKLPWVAFGIIQSVAALSVLIATTSASFARPEKAKTE
ncbi:major facilitator superfamily domain-containing protein [Obelidium mucronatum]|nr:major facilitator superfamily domain-containing protein [Obelidium mucronatum]